MFPAAVLLFPVTYIANDILSEIYGFTKTRKIIWLGFFINFFTVAFFALTLLLPSPSFFEGSAAYAAVLGSTPRVLGASLCAYLAGSFLNASTVSRLKAAAEKQSGRQIRPAGSLAFRLILSTIIGESTDSVIFITLAFIGSMPLSSLKTMIFTQATIKILYETALYPLTRTVILKLRKKERSGY
jgi:uncharacterized integral membrane protein (TIGR00697 family)